MLVQALSQEQLGSKDTLDGLMCFSSSVSGDIQCTSYDNSPTDRKYVDAHNAQKLQLDPTLGWFYYSFTDYNTKEFGVGRSNIFTGTAHEMKFTPPFKGLLPFTINNAPEPTYIFFISGNKVYRALGNGGNVSEIYTVSTVNKEPTALVYSSKIRKLYVVVMNNKASDFNYCELHLMNSDGTNSIVLDDGFDVINNGFVRKFIIDTSEVTPTKLLPKMAYLWRNEKPIYGIKYYNGTKGSRGINVWTGRPDYTVYDFAFDPISKSYVIIADYGTWKIQPNITPDRRIDIKAAGVFITQSVCPKNCNLNGKCMPDKTCRCAQHWYLPTCDKYCSDSNCIYGYCQDDGTCKCNFNYGGPECREKQNFPPIFPQTLIFKNVTVFNLTTNQATIIKTIFFDQIEQKVRTDFANGTTVIDRYDTGFSFVIDKTTCKLYPLPPTLPIFRTPADSTYNGKIDCGLSKQCDVWWSKSEQVEFDVVQTSADQYLPIVKKDMGIVTSYDFANIKVTTPDRSVFDYPESCL